MLVSPAQLAETEFLDHGTPEVRALVAKASPADGATLAERAVRLYYAVRDGIRYEVYGADLSRTGLRASQVLRRGSGMCLHKSLVYAAALRAIGVPSRLVLADVRNHLASPRLRELLGGDVFHQHCVTELDLNGRRLRATPVFNRTLCRLYRIPELHFDGTADSVHHPYGPDGAQRMKFLREHGVFDDLPYDFVLSSLRAAHPRLFASDATPVLAEGSLADEA
ncbi:transglutaminase family protein [Streptomyces sp. ST2-7A]|uniref:transglutaminase-like domain-containing protein n=1 Tax=Streptomyces sp. ST2-7A TaxID=2907214 RepID=UPI001F3AE308|nr:transglutaminase-like domain-containing protein [Streptomyces sp. ST2-7A]MCE7081108.1 transglutaminase-like domain-containing protein [Streptomyces sp. ST2-7A]